VIEVPDKRVKATLVVRNIGQLVTMDGASQQPARHPNSSTLRILGAESCVAARDNKICFVGNRSEISELCDCSGAEEIDAQGCLVLPGFVDAHTHSIFFGSRESELTQKLQGFSYVDILRNGGGILRTVRETRKASDEQIIVQTKSRLNRMLQCGTTTFEIKSGYGLSVDEEIRLLRIIKQLQADFKFDIVPTLLAAHAVPEEFEHNSESYIKDVVYPVTDLVSKDSLAEFFDVFLEEGVFSRQQCKAMLNYAEQKGFALKIHADEFSDLGGAKIAAEQHVTSADHLLRSSKEGVELLGKSSVISVLLPGTSLTSFAPGYANARAIIDSGGAVALGTDLSPNSWIESMHLVVCLACYCMRMTPAEAIVGATINAAHAIRRSSDVGSIELGKKCDLLITNLNDYQEIPYRLGSNIVTKVVKSGSIISDS
jgi:imidazolonepropionase